MEYDDVYAWDYDNIVDGDDDGDDTHSKSDTRELSFQQMYKRKEEKKKRGKKRNLCTIKWLNLVNNEKSLRNVRGWSTRTRP